MSASTDTVLVFVVLTNLMLLGTSRIRTCVRLTAVQGVLLGILTILVQGEPVSARAIALAVVSTAVKGIVFPWLLFRALRETSARREVEPYVGYTLSLLVGMIALGGSLWLGSKLPLPGRPPAALAAPVAFFSILSGLFLIVSRKTALTQVLGYLVMENGIYTFGISLAHEEHLLVELGILLDAFVAVFVMGITIFHISREFDTIEADRLSALKDTKE